MTARTGFGPRFWARPRDERGFTLVELVVAMALTTGVAAIAGSLFLTSIRGNAQVTSTTQATIQAQGVAQGIERAVRNAQAISRTTTTLTVWTTLGGSRACQRWTVADGTVKVSQAASTPLPSPVAHGIASPGATLSFPAEVTSGSDIVGVTYEVTYPTEKTPDVKVTGTVRSRTPHNPSANPCGI